MKKHSIIFSLVICGFMLGCDRPLPEPPSQKYSMPESPGTKLMRDDCQYTAKSQDEYTACVTDLRRKAKCEIFDDKMLYQSCLENQR
jgi:hypothetical protein